MFEVTENSVTNILFEVNYNSAFNDLISSEDVLMIHADI